MKKIKKHKVIIDTNLWISFLLTSSVSKLDKIIGNNSVTLLTGDKDLLVLETFGQAKIVTISDYLIDQQ
jgi:predicted nucleic acid-binding protein